MNKMMFDTKLKKKARLKSSNDFHMILLRYAS